MTDWNSELERLRGAYADTTIAGYRNDFRLFSHWCEAEGHAALPARPETIVAYLNAHIVHLKATTLTRRVVAILRIHRLLALPDPTGHEDVRLALRRIKRFRPGRPRQAHGITRALRQRMLAACGDDLTGKRDRALVALGFEGLCRRSEISALEVTDLVANIRGGLSVTIRRGKADQVGEGRVVGLSPDTAEILGDWIAAAGIIDGPLICPVYKGRVVQRQMRGFSIARILKRIAEQAGFAPEIVARISGHSLRVGAAQSLAVDGRSVLEIMRVGGWRSITTVARYVENAEITVWQ